MAQIKKPEIHQAILDAAGKMFREYGYHGASMAQIAKHSGVSSANIYVYFASKLEILFTLFDPWQRARLEQLEADVMKIENPRERLRFILKTLWHEIPGEENCFANNLMQALSTASPKDKYSRELLFWAEQKLSMLIASCLPEDRRYLCERGSIAHILFMAFDGFAMNHKLNGPSKRIDHSVDLMVTMLAGSHPDPISD